MLCNERKKVNWNEYQQQALTTAIYPLKRELEYTAFGLLSELGELIAARVNGDKDLIRGELGDNFWYTAALADAIKWPLECVYSYTTTFRPVTTEQSLEALVVLGGLIAGHIKKSIRDDDGFVSPKREKNIVACVSKYMHHLEFITSDYGSVNGILNENLNKLADRKSRGVLQGSGDKR